jgi:hypothetical protein
LNLIIFPWQALDVNYLTRKATTFVSPHPHLELYKEGDHWVMKISSTFKSIECKFKVRYSRSKNSFQFFLGGKAVRFKVASVVDPE